LSARRQFVSDCGSTSGHAVEHHHGAVEDAQGSVHLDGEITCPGVSIRMVFLSRQNADTAALEW